MQRANIPTRFLKAFGADADPAYIRTVPVDSQIGVQDGAASYETGFPPDCFSPVSAGGTPPFGQDVNGVFFETTTWDQWYQAGGAIPYNADFATAIGGYPQGAILDSSIVLGAQWYSTADNNLTDPDDPLTSTGWLRVGIPAGMPMPFLTSVPTGFVIARGDYTLGSASSGATYANANALFLFAANWSNSQLAIYTSGGVLTTRGANAIADFAANKRLQMPEGRGTGLIGVDAGSSTNLSGVPVVAGNTTTPGSTLGENLHALIAGENGPHDHNVYLRDPTHGHTYVAPAGGVGTGTSPNYFLSSSASSTTNSAATGLTIGSVAGVANDNKTASSGSGTGHNNVERSLGVNWGQKL